MPSGVVVIGIVVIEFIEFVVEFIVFVEFAVVALVVLLFVVLVVRIAVVLVVALVVKQFLAEYRVAIRQRRLWRLRLATTHPRTTLVLHPACATFQQQLQ